MLAPRASLVLALLLVLGSLSAASLAQPAGQRYLRPSNSGLPGEEVRLVRWAPDGDLWVAARWPFWQEGGIGVLDRDTDVWSVWSNWETPLPSEYLNDLEFGPDGTAWIATGGGLVHFDGQTWTVYDASNSPLAFDAVKNLSVAPDGHVWVNSSSSQQGGDAIWEFDGESTWTDYRVPDDLPWADPWTDLEDVLATADGHVWVANEVLDGIAEFDGATWTLHGADVTRFDSLAEGTDGRIWCIGNPVGGDQAYFVFDGATFTRWGFASPTRITVDPEDGAIYAGNWYGTVLRSTDQGASWTTYLGNLNHVFQIAPQPGSTDVWIGTQGALGHFTANGGHVRDYNSYNTGLPWYWIDGMSTDRDGFFWVATGEAGLSRFDGERWRNWGTHNAGAEPYPFGGNEPMGAAYQDQTGTHWFGGNGIARWESATGQFTGFWNWENNPGMGVGLWIAFAEDAAGDLFSVEEHGNVYRFDTAQELWVLEPVDTYAPSGMPGIATGSDGTIWLPDWFAIHRWDGSAWTTVDLPYADYFFDLGGINCVAIGPDDVLWFGTVEGLVRRDGSQFTLFDPGNSPLPAGNVRGIDVRADGLIGLSAADDQAATGAAVIAGDPADPASWTVHTQLPHWQLDTVAFDAEGDLWVSALSMGVAILETGGGPTAVGRNAIPRGLVLGPPAPNPFNPRVTLTFTLPAGGADVALDVVDLRGRRVARLTSGRLAGGRHEVTWDGRDADGRAAASGVYLARLRAGAEVTSRKLVLAR